MLDRLDVKGRFALLKLLSGALRVGVSARLAKTGIAQAFGLQKSPPVGVIFGLVFVIAGLAFKVAAVPFHMWTPDVYEGSPTPVTAFFAAAPKVAAISLFVRVLIGPFGDLLGQWQQVIVVISIASMILGSLAAIWHTNFTRLLAYSSIGHMGYALIGLRRPEKGLFQDIEWGGPEVMDETRKRLAALGWTWRELDTLWDVDRPEDYARLTMSALLDERSGGA